MKHVRMTVTPGLLDLTFSLVTLAATGLLVGCSSSSSPATGGDDAGPTENDAGLAMETSSTALTVTPTPVNVLTCDTQQFTEAGGAAGGTWSVAPASGSGSITSTGLYAAPNVTPANASLAVAYAVGGASASAALTLGTAFVGTPGSVPVSNDPNSVPQDPFEAIFAASGSQVYAGVIGPTDTTTGGEEEVDVYASSDNGKTFTGPTAYHTGDVECGVIAADPVDSSVVYIAYLAGHGDSTSNTGATLRLAVSADGAKTFPTEYILADSDNSIASLICPDIVAPSANHVIVSGALGGDENPSWVATFQSSNRGAGIGPIGQEGMEIDGGGDFTTSSDTNSGSASACTIYDDGSAGSPRIVSNANGDACVIFERGSGCDALPNPVLVQCSQDNGLTWTSPTMVDGNTISNTYPTGAVSPGGNIAVAYTKPVVEEAGTQNETFIVISKDGGKTWTAPIQYPTASWMALAGDDPEGLADQTLHWESDNILWLSASLEAGNQDYLFVDKTCDFGATWSGAVKGGNYEAAGILATGAGVAVGAYITAGGSGPALNLVPLSP